MKIIIRDARISDAMQLSRIAVAAKKYWNYPDSWFELWGNTFEITQEFIVNNRVWVARNENDLLGFAAISLNETTAELEHMWVLPAYMGQGIGKMFIKKIIEFCKLNGIKKVRIEADPNAKAFYEKMGARHIGYVDSKPEPRKLPVLVIEI